MLLVILMEWGSDLSRTESKEQVRSSCFSRLNLTFEEQEPSSAAALPMDHDRHLNQPPMKPKLGSVVLTWTKKTTGV